MRFLWNDCALYHSYSLHCEFHNERAIKQLSCQTVKLSVHYGTWALKFFIGSRIFSKIIGIFPTFFFSWNVIKLKINFIFWLLLCFKELIWTKNNYWNKISTHTAKQHNSVIHRYFVKNSQKCWFNPGPEEHYSCIPSPLAPDPIKGSVKCLMYILNQ